MTAEAAQTRASALPSPAVWSDERARPPSQLAVVIAASAVSGALLVSVGWAVPGLSTIATFAALGLAVAHPLAGLGVLAFIAPLPPPTVIPPPGFHIVLVGAILLGCLYRLPIDRPEFRPSPALFPLVAFVAFVAVQQLPFQVDGYAGDVGHLVGYMFFQVLASFGAVVAAGWALAGRSPYGVLAMALAGAGAAGLIAVLSFVNAPSGPPLTNLVPPVQDASRAIGPFGNPNYLGVFAATATAAAAGWAAGRASRVARAVLLALGFLLVVTVALSLSRGAMLALLVGTGWLLFVRHRGLAIALLTVAPIAVLLLYPIFTQWRLESLTGGAVTTTALSSMSASDAGRLSGILAGPQLFLTSPIIGVGFGLYTVVAPSVTGEYYAIAAHNWYINVLAEQGLVGITLWLLVLAAVWRGLRRRPAAARAVGFATFGAFVTGSLFLEPPTSFQAAALPGIVIVAALVARWPDEAALPEAGAPARSPLPGS